MKKKTCRGIRPICSVFWLFLFLSLFGWNYCVAQQNSIEDSLRLNYMDFRLKLLEDRFQETNEDVEKQVSYVLQLNEKAFRLFYIFGTIGTIITALIVFSTFVRDSKQNQLITNQTENLEKIGGVITLIQSAFKLREEEEKKLKEIDEKFEKFKTQVFEKGYIDLYVNARESILSFRQLNRMQWPTLSQVEQRVIDKARSTFETMPPYILERREQEEPRELAKVNILLGVSAFYANDIHSAKMYLNKGDISYPVPAQEDGADEREEYFYLRGAANHYLGVIEKNWRKDEGLKETPEENHLEQAIKYLEKANSFLREYRADEYLTPVTIAEVFSYSESQRKKSQDLIEKIIGELEALKASSSEDFNVNKSKLLGRAYLIRGNLGFMVDNFEEALNFYDKAAKHNESNPYALLSLAQAATANGKKDVKLWKRGLKALKQSGNLEKREISVKAWAHVWATLAAFRSNNPDKEQYWSKFKEMEARPVAGLEPMFFDPITKGLVIFEKLKQNLMEEIA